MCPLLTSIHWWHQLFMPSIKLSDIEMGREDQIWSKPCSTSCKNLGGEFKVATCLLRWFQRFFVWFRSGDFCLSFYSHETVTFKILLSNCSSEKFCIIILQNEIIPSSTSIWVYIWIKVSSWYFTPVRIPPWNTYRSVCQPSVIPAWTMIPLLL